MCLKTEQIKRELTVAWTTGLLTKSECMAEYERLRIMGDMEEEEDEVPDEKPGLAA